MRLSIPLLALFLVTVDLSGRIAADDLAPERSARPTETPEAAAAEFLLAVLEGDERKILSVTIPKSGEEVLWNPKTRLKPGELEAGRASIRPSALRRLKLGDTVQVPGGKSVVLDETRISKTRQEVTAPGMPVPVIVRKIDERWLVDAGPVIAARRAAVAASNKPQPPASIWTAEKSQLELLGAQQRFGPLKMSPPRDYTETALSEAGTETFAWTGPAHKDKTAPLLLATIAPVTKEAKEYTLSRALHDVIEQSVAPRCDEFQRTPSESGLLAGYPFVRAHWEGKYHATTRFPAAPKHGVVYLGRVNDKFVIFLASDSDPSATETLPLLEATILSFAR